VNHARARSLLSAYLERDLPAIERSEVDAHLSDCAECAAELAELGETVALLRGLPTPEPPPYLVTRVMARIAEGEAEPRGLRRWLAPLLGPALAAPLAAGVAALAVFAFAPGPAAEAPGPATVARELPPSGPAILTGQTTAVARNATHPRIGPRRAGRVLQVSPSLAQELRGAGHPHSSALAAHFDGPHAATVVSWSGR
jgi:anti-sigma factor RsiW